MIAKIGIGRADVGQCLLKEIVGNRLLGLKGDKYLSHIWYMGGDAIVEHRTHCILGGTKLVENLIGVVTTVRYVAHTIHRHFLIDTQYRFSDV